MMYTLRGILQGRLCDDCVEPLSHVLIRVYRAQRDDVLTHATAPAKETYRILTDEDTADRTESLLAEAEADDEGRFVVRIDGDKHDYNGGPVEIDVLTRRMPGQDPDVDIEPVQFTITTIQAAWREGQDGAVAAFEHVLSHRFWCAIRARLGLWVICGRVTHCETRQPVPGVTVRAFDADWIQDDPLGSGVTDVHGHFRIYYTSKTFKRTPFSFISLEWVSGPDVYFRIDNPGGGPPLLVENRSRGRDKDRENVGPCFCARLCVATGPQEPPPDDYAEPQFTHVGQYQIPNLGLLNDFTAAGFADDGDPLAFTGTLDLIGALPNGVGGSGPAKEFRFRFAAFNPATSSYGPLQDVDTTKIAATRIGSLQYYKLVGSSLLLASENYWLNNPAQPHNATVKTGGWIEVPTENDLGNPATNTPGTGKFVRNSDLLIKLISTQLINESFDLTVPTVHQAGNPVPAAQKSTTHTFKLVFESRDVGGGNLRTDELAKIVLTNTQYKQRRHPSWNMDEPTLSAVVMLDIAELSGPGNGCKKITTDLHARYTVYHPHLKSAALTFEGNPSLPAAFNAPVSGNEAASGPAGKHYDTSSLNPCAYILWLTAVLNVTHGYGRPSSATLHDRIAFCIAGSAP